MFPVNLKTVEFPKSEPFQRKFRKFRRKKFPKISVYLPRNVVLFSGNTEKMLLHSSPQISENSNQNFHPMESTQCIVKSLGRGDYFLGWLSSFFAWGKGVSSYKLGLESGKGGLKCYCDKEYTCVNLNTGFYFVAVLAEPRGRGSSECWSGQADTRKSHWWQEGVVKATGGVTKRRTGWRWWTCSEGTFCLSVSLFVCLSLFLPVFQLGSVLFVSIFLKHCVTDSS